MSLSPQIYAPSGEAEKEKIPLLQTLPPAKKEHEQD
jgi:hypothetical protein